jgi:hypothetical protein
LDGLASHTKDIVDVHEANLRVYVSGDICGIVLLDLVRGHEVGG